MINSNENFFVDFPEKDSDWTEENWKQMIDYLVNTSIISYKDSASAILGSLNPPQVGTSIATKKTFKSLFQPRKCWQAVRNWFYSQSGKCADCGTSTHLQADHIISRKELGNKADYLENITLRCRRCNVIRRPSHKKGGLTFLTTQSALMWILFCKRPETYQEYLKLCKGKDFYNLTMANIRVEEAWAKARWLEKEGLYYISPESKH